MTTYIITAGQTFCAACIIQNGLITQAPPIIKWTVGKEWTAVLAYCRARGWQVEAIPEKEHPTWIEWQGIAFELQWNLQGLARVFKHEEGERTETTFSRLPDEIRELIST